MFSSEVGYLDGGLHCEGGMCAFFKDGNLFHCLNIRIMLSSHVPVTCKVLKERRTTDVMLISAEFQDVTFDTSNKR